MKNQLFFVSLLLFACTDETSGVLWVDAGETETPSATSKTLGSSTALGLDAAVTSARDVRSTSSTSSFDPDVTGDAAVDAGILGDANAQERLDAGVGSSKDAGSTDASADASTDLDAAAEMPLEQGCGGAAPLYRAGMTATGLRGTRLTLLESRPSPPGVGNNTWTLHLATSEGLPLDGVWVEVVPFMPEHQHGSPSKVRVSEVGEGVYEAASMDFSMPGFWQNTVTVVMEGGQDEVLLDVCIK